MEVIIWPCKSHICIVRAAATTHLIGAGSLYLLVATWSSSSLGLRRYAEIFGRKTSIFDEFCFLTQKSLPRVSNLFIRPECSDDWTLAHLLSHSAPASQCRDLQSPSAPDLTSGYRDRGSNTFFSLSEPTCTLSLISNRGLNLII